jgi:hypothetical protein
MPFGNLAECQEASMVRLSFPSTSRERAARIAVHRDLERQFPRVHEHLEAFVPGVELDWEQMNPSPDCKTQLFTHVQHIDESLLFRNFQFRPSGIANTVLGVKRDGPGGICTDTMFVVDDGLRAVAIHTWAENDGFVVKDLFANINPDRVAYLVHARSVRWTKWGPRMRDALTARWEYPNELRERPVFWSPYSGRSLDVTLYKLPREGLSSLLKRASLFDHLRLRLGTEAENDADAYPDLLHIPAYAPFGEAFKQLRLDIGRWANLYCGSEPPGIASDFNVPLHGTIGTTTMVISHIDEKDCRYQIFLSCGEARLRFYQMRSEVDSTLTVIKPEEWIVQDMYCTMAQAQHMVATILDATERGVGFLHPAD